jgi:hypothetical protein
MKLKHNRLILVGLLIVLLVSLFPATTAFAAHTITSVVPPQVVNDVNTTITITGTGFDSTAEVSLGGYALLRLTQSATEITAQIPAGIPAGSYAVTVTMAGGADVATCASPCVTVLTPTPAPPTPTSITVPFTRPQFVVRSSRLSGTVQKDKEVTLKVVLENAGYATAYSSQAVFTSSDLTPTKTGGVAAIGTVAYDSEVDVSQTFIVTNEMFGKTVIVVNLAVTYYDDKGTSFTDTFTLSIPVNGGSGTTGGGGIVATATPTGVKSSQLVITNYSTSIDPLQPGEDFALNLTVQNVGNVKAQRITMIVGGGSSGGGGGTPQAGGVSAGGGDFANFAPVGASNVQSLGDLGAGESLQASQNLIVNVNTVPGAYPMRITFSYLNDKNEVINDEQVITLLVYSLPNVDVSFYRPPDTFFVGQPGTLPIQIVNIGKRFIVLGSMVVSAETGFIENGTSLIGPLDAGGYFTLDAFFTPEQSGLQTLTVTIQYVDDFNQTRTLTKTLEIEVMDAFIEPTPDPSFGGGGGGEFPVQEETFWHKVFRFIKGLLGLDSTLDYYGDATPAQFETIPIQGG